MENENIDKNVRNAIIKKAEIQIEDHGSLTVWLYLDYADGMGQGFGGYVLYLPKSFKHHSIESVAGHYIFRLMEVADVRNWKDLPGKAVRVKSEWSKVHGIGHIIKDDWFFPDIDFAPLREGKSNEG